VETLEEAETNAAATAQAVRAAGVTARDIQFENSYDGFSLFHVSTSRVRFAGIKQGEALDLFQTTSPSTANPVSPSGATSAAAAPLLDAHRQHQQIRAGRRPADEHPRHIGCRAVMPF